MNMPEKPARLIPINANDAIKPAPLSRKTLGDLELEAEDKKAPGCDICGRPYVVAEAGHLPVVAMLYPRGRNRRGVRVVVHPGARHKRFCEEHDPWFRSRLQCLAVAAE
jgi:hypothetical protein